YFNFLVYQSRLFCVKQLLYRSYTPSTRTLYQMAAPPSFGFSKQLEEQQLTRIQSGIAAHVRASVAFRRCSAHVAISRAAFDAKRRVRRVGRRFSSTSTSLLYFVCCVWGHLGKSSSIEFESARGCALRSPGRSPPLENVIQWRAPSFRADFSRVTCSRVDIPISALCTRTRQQRRRKFRRFSLILKLVTQKRRAAVRVLVPMLGYVCVPTHTHELMSAQASTYAYNNLYSLARLLLLGKFSPRIYIGMVYTLRRLLSVNPRTTLPLLQENVKSIRSLATPMVSIEKPTLKVFEASSSIEYSPLVSDNTKESKRLREKKIEKTTISLHVQEVKFPQLSDGSIRFSEISNFHRENRHQTLRATYVEKF
ncbi:unnamed protein product, partial [Trichogramma brassicae]